MLDKEAKYDLQERLIQFAVRITEVVEALPKTRVGNHVASQLVRSGTSPASNYGEAQGAESQPDFVHKMKVALKELRETQVWLQIARRRLLIKPATRLDAVLVECDEIIAVFYTSIRTAEKRAKKQQ